MSEKAGPLSVLRQVSGGRYQRKIMLVRDGERFAVPTSPGRAHTHISSAVRNSDGQLVQVFLSLDIDANKTNGLFKDDSGAIEISHVLEAFNRDLSFTRDQIRYAVRSSGGKGIHIHMAIPPMPITETTRANQRLFTAAQKLLCEWGSSLGLGIDVGAIGTNRDFASWQDASNRLYTNDLAGRRERKEKTPVLSVITAEVRACLKELRLYKDARVERGFARLLLFLAGETEDVSLPKAPMFLSFDTAELTRRELKRLTSFSDEFIAKLWSGSITLPWLLISNGEGSSRQFRLKVDKSLAARFEKARALAPMELPASTKRYEFSLANLASPEGVEDGLRNAAIWKWAVALKMAGICEVDAQRIVRKLSLRIPGSERSRNCKARQIRAVVKSIYRNKARGPSGCHEVDTFGICTIADLPYWMQEEIWFKGEQKKSTPLSEEAVAVVSSPGLAFPSVSEASQENSDSKLLHLGHVSSKNNRESQTLVPTLPACGPLEPSNPEKPKQSPPPRNLRLAVVYWGHRVGLFDGLSPVLICTSGRNFKVGKALEYLHKRNSYKEVVFTAWYPKSTHPMMKDWRNQIAQATWVPIAQQICGRAPTLREVIFCNERGSKK